MSLWKKSAVLAVTAVTAFAVTACGSDSDSSESGTQQQTSVLQQLVSDLKGSLQKVAEATEKAESVTVKMEGTVAGQKFVMNGAIDLGDPVKFEMTMPGEDGPTTIRMIGTTIYTQLPESQRQADGKSWIKMDMAAIGEMAGMDVTKQFEDMDPAKQVKTLLATEGVKAVGEETVNGAATVHYTVNAPLSTYLGQLDAETRKNAEAELTKNGVTEVKIDLWVDEQYQPRRAHVVMGVMSDLTIDYTDYGKPVNVEEPPASETTDLAQMLEELKGLG